MTTTELKHAIETALTEVCNWRVSVDEAQMLNITADDLESCEGFIYVEEFDTQTTSFVRGISETNRHDVYFCKIVPFDMTAEQREHVRDTKIRPVVLMVEKYLHEHFGIDVFNTDKFPRGFDANEVLMHISFVSSRIVC